MKDDSSTFLLLLAGVVAFLWWRAKQQGKDFFADILGNDAPEPIVIPAPAMPPQAPAVTVDTGSRGSKPSTVVKVGGVVGAAAGTAVCAVYAQGAIPLCAAAGGYVGGKLAPVVVNNAKGYVSDAKKAGSAIKNLPKDPGKSAKTLLVDLPVKAATKPFTDASKVVKSLKFW